MVAVTIKSCAVSAVPALVAVALMAGSCSHLTSQPKFVTVPREDNSTAVLDTGSAVLVVEVRRGKEPVRFQYVWVRRSGDYSSGEMRCETDDDGILTVEHLPPGLYYVRVTAVGYESQLPDTVMLERGATARVRHAVTGQDPIKVY